MRLVFLCKRRPQGRDLFNDPFGRFYYIPWLLRQRGHDVHLLLLSYQNDPAESRSDNGLNIHTNSALPRAAGRYVEEARRLCDEIRPDWIIGLSDIWYAILAARLAKAQGARLLIDAYDNYESYMPWAKPLHWAWRRALARADAVTAAGPRLAELICQRSGRATVAVVPMAADPAFVPLPKAECRRRVGLPQGRTLVGYCGSLHPNRGAGLLFSVFERLQNLNIGIELVVSGRYAVRTELRTGVHWLGYRPAEQMPCIVNSMDLLMVINKPGSFGNYSHPVKLYEAMACGVPVVATDVPGTAWVMRDHPGLLARAGDIEDFEAKVLSALTHPKVNYSATTSWEASANLFERLLLT